jgi:hypothetical protein
VRLSSLLNLSLIVAGAAGSVPALRRRHAWEQANRQAYIVLDYDDALAVSTRAGLPLAEFLGRAQQHGATHAALPELTLNRLMREGRLLPVVPAGLAEGREEVRARRQGGPPGQVYLAGTERTLVEHVATELCARLPDSEAHVLAEAPVPTLSARGDLPTLAEMGLGFEAGAAAEVLLAGLELAPRPVSFAWPEAHLVERTLAQAAGLGAKVVAFDGDLILGHEMHLETTVAGLLRHGLSFAYFCETRHQKGDWFLAKRLAPRGQVILSHYFTPAAMVPEDFHSAAHHWGMLARNRGIRLCYVNVFRRIHATEPLECLHYLEHIKEELLEDGLRFSPGEAKQRPLDAPDRLRMALSGMAPAGAAALAASQALSLSEPAALGATALAVAGAAALPYADRPRGQLEAAYPPSYAPKLLALAGAAAAPTAAALADGPAAAMLVQVGMAASRAALTTGRDYQLRIEEYRSLNLDLVLPLAGVLWRRLEPGRWKWLSAVLLGAAWYALRPLAADCLGRLNQDLPAGHTHHLSRAQRLVGDARLALGLRPARKWAGVGLAALAAARWLRKRNHQDAALAAEIVATAANALMLAAFRQPERSLVQTGSNVARSWAGWGTAAAAAEVIALLSDGFRGAGD